MKWLYRNANFLGALFLVCFFGYRLGQLECSHNELDHATAEVIHTFASKIKDREGSDRHSLKIEGDIIGTLGQMNDNHRALLDIQEQQTEAILDAEAFVRGLADFIGYPPECNCTQETTFAGVRK